MRQTKRPPAIPRKPTGADATLRSLQAELEALRARETLLESVINALPIWISVKDPEGRYLLVNDALARAHGAKPAEFLGKTAEAVGQVYPGVRTLMAGLDQHVLESDESAETYRHHVRVPGAGERIRHVTKTPLHDARGKVVGVVGWSEDVTDQTMADDALETNRKLLRAVIDVVPHAISYVDAELCLQMVNPAWCALFGYQAEEVVGLPILEWDGLPASMLEQLYQDNRELLRTGRAPKPREYAFPTGSGKDQVHIVAKAPVRNADGTVEGVVTIAVDVTDLRTAEARAELAHARLADAMESLPAAFYLYDTEERLVLANSMAAAYYPAERELLKPGTPYSDIMRAGLSNQRIDPGDMPHRLELGLRRFREPHESFEQHLTDGRIMLGRNRRTRDGGTVSVRFDITEQKRIQAELEASQLQMQGDLALAAELQRNILRPPQPPPFLQVAYRFQPSTRVSGDLFHAHVDSCGDFHLFVGDATGHGVAAAFLTMLIEAGLSGLPEGTAPKTALERLNGMLLDYDLAGRFVSGIYVVIGSDGRCELVNAGHPPAVRLPASGAAEQHEPGGFPLGWFESGDFASVTWRMAPGETLLLHTDGLIERSDAMREQFGAGAVLRTIERLSPCDPEHLATGLLEAAAAHAGEQPPEDDVTLFVVRYRGTP